MEQWPATRAELLSVRFERGVYLFDRMYYSDVESLFRRLVAFGFIRAGYYLGLTLMRKAWDAPSSEAEEVFAALSRGHRLGDSAATLELALCYGRGIGCTKDPKVAYELAVEAACSGHPRAAAVAARCAMTAFGCPYDIGTARGFLEQAAADQVPELQCALARCLFLGEGGGQDTNRAVQLYRSAAIGGSEVACMALASIARSEGRISESIEWIGRMGDSVPDEEVGRAGR
jgi:TPR repeat protein